MFRVYLMGFVGLIGLVLVGVQCTRNLKDRNARDAEEYRARVEAYGIVTALAYPRPAEVDPVTGDTYYRYLRVRLEDNSMLYLLRVEVPSSMVLAKGSRFRLTSRNLNLVAVPLTSSE